MADYPNDRRKLPGPGERIRQIAENAVPSGGIPAEAAYAGAGGHEAHGGGDYHSPHHPSAITYVIIGVILTVITAVEVSAYYIPAWEGSAIYVPSMLFLSAVKFFIVVMFYMHLKYDHKLFRALFTGPFIIAFLTICALMFLFGKLAVRLGILT
jgi:cytochrome c oxidase subunit 4